jgi:hypothetical protein
MTDAYKWIIKNNGVLSDEERMGYWEKTHSLNSYESVWSMTDDQDVRNKIENEIKQVPIRSKILIPGCGSRVSLQNQIAESFYDNQVICCTDYPKVIDVARSKINHNKIIYLARNSTDLGFHKEWDIVVNINAVLSENDEENRAILKSTFNALDQGGFFIGMFPTILASVDIAYLEKDRNRLRFINLNNSSFFESKQGIWQIFYTPLRLKYILKEAGYELKKMELFFCDSEYFIKHSKDYYGIDDPDIFVYELFVLAIKP